MESTSLFQFPFTDRFAEREKMNEFIESEHGSNILWINGDHGIGKTFFLDNVLSENNDYNIIKVSIDPEVELPDYLKALVLSLQQASGIKFNKFIKANFKSILNIAKNIVVHLLKINNLELDELMEAIFDSSQLFVDNNDVKQSSEKAIGKYISHIISKKKTILVLDNFIYCEKKSLRIIGNILISFYNNPNVKFILVTSEDDSINSKGVLDYISENIPCIPLPMHALNDSIYFYQIISNVFELEGHRINEMVECIFQLCGGNPSRLKTVIQNLLFTKDAISFSDADMKAYLNSDKLQEYILSKSTDIDLTLLNETQNFILQIISSFGEHMTLCVLKGLFSFLTSKMHIGIPLSQYAFDNELNRLVSTDILKATEKNDDFEVSIGNDLTFFYLSVVMRKRLNRFQLSHYIFQYLSDQREMLRNFYSDDQLNSLLALHSFLGKRTDWKDINYRIGLEKYQKGLIAEAFMCFRRIVSDIDTLNEEKKLIVAECCYDNGEYDLAMDILKKIDVEIIQDNKRYSYNFLYGKVYFVKMQASQAEQYFRKAIEVCTDRNNTIAAYNMLHMSILESDSDRSKAKEVFDQTVEKYPLSSPAMAQLLKCCTYYYSGKKSLKYLTQALRLAQQEQDVLTEANIYNSLGVEYYRIGQQNLGCENLHKAKDLMENLRPHEIAYPLCNLASCALLEKNYKQALKYLAEAEFWVTSPYIKIVNKVLTFSCYNLLKEDYECAKRAEWLLKYINDTSIQDPAIIRKICISLAIYYDRVKKSELAISCIQRAFPLLKGTVSEYRGTSLMNQLSGTDYEIPCPPHNSIYYKTLEFEPWLTYISHY